MKRGCGSEIEHVKYAHIVNMEHAPVAKRVCVQSSSPCSGLSAQLAVGMVHGWMIECHGYDMFVTHRKFRFLVTLRERYMIGMCLSV